VALRQDVPEREADRLVAGEGDDEDRPLVGEQRRPRLAGREGAYDLLVAGPQPADLDRLGLRGHGDKALMAQIRELMTVKPRTVKTGDSIIEAAKLMKGEDAGIAPIVDGDRLVGVVTDRDIAIRVVAEGRDPQSTKVEEIASQNVVTVDPQQELDEALRLMAQHQVRRLPVVEEDGRLVGIVAQADVARHADAQRTGEVVEDISR
jgi:CBS domain-containing protein